MRAKLKGINTVRRPLANGREAVYHYHRATGVRLKGEPGSPEFIAAIAAAEARRRNRSDGTLSGVIRAFETKSLPWRRLAESTRKEYRRVLTFWEDRYGTCPHAGLEDKAFRSDVLAWHAAYADEYPREADNRVTILARVLSWAAKDGPLSKNVLDGFDRAYEGDRSEKIWLPLHVEAFMAAASPEMQVAMVLALHTGQRQGDIRSFAWTNYDGARLSLRQGKSRRGQRPGRLITIKCTNALKATLDGLERRSTLILTTKTGRAFQKRYLAKQWDETCKAAGIEGLHFHDLRGTTVTMLFEAGCNLGEIVAITGHSLRRAQEILDRYLARTRTLADSAIAKLENVLETNFAKHAAKREGVEDAK